ncbi:hypothetical protein BG011_006417 [Mortierella polycephala]|uniref:FAD-binding domain-containing protein n=1 Tax=Mortierella polycephala TaxID=41804 RepID=A0A9P6TZK8_9FUNG|nr:hypothetical protein BG011_006417 [Mortierella polycephala]
MASQRRHKHKYRDARDGHKSKPYSQQSSLQTKSGGPGQSLRNAILLRQRVVIVGGNVQGLVLGMILERIGIDYLILERSFNHGITAGVQVLGAFALNLFEMLGILGQIKDAASELHRMRIWTESGVPQAEADFTGAEERFSHNGAVVSCRVLQDLMRAEIPEHKMKDGKEVTGYEQDADEVRVLCSDGSVYRGVILVGCDGVQSTVRRLLHEESGADLPARDRVQSRRTCIVTGATRTLDGTTLLDPDSLQNLFELEYANNQVVIGQSTPYVAWMLPIPNEPRISWMITYNQPVDSLPAFDDDNEPGPDSMDRPSVGQEFLSQVRQENEDSNVVSVESRVHMGDILDQTDPHDIRVVQNQRRLYDMWFKGRVVLAGDACHALVPGGGQGVLQAMLDAYSLAPLIKHALLSSLDIAGEGQLEHISVAFECYKRERYDIARDAVEASTNLSQLLTQQQGPSFDQQQPQMPGQFHIDFAFDFFPGWLQRYAERRPFGQDEDENENEDEDEL